MRGEIQQLCKETREQKKKAADQNLPKIAHLIITIFKISFVRKKHQIIFKLLLPEPPKIIRQKRTQKGVVKSCIKPQK